MIGPRVERGLLLSGLLAAIRLSEQPMVLTDPQQPDNPLIAVNPAFEALTLYSEAELVGRNCRLLQGAQTDRGATRRLGECLHKNEGCVQFLTNYRRDGTQFFNLLFVVPVKGHDGQIQFFFASQYDLSGESHLLPDSFPLGPASLSPGQETEFRLLLFDIAHEVGEAKLAEGLPGRVRALEAAVAAARELAKLSTEVRSRSPHR